MVNPVSVSNAQIFKQATQVADQRQQQNEQAAKASKDASGGNAAKNSGLLVTNQKNVNNTQTATIQATAAKKDQTQAPQPASQQKPNTYSSVDIKA